MFLSRLEDLFSLSRDKYKTKFSQFLNERQADIAREFARQNRCDNFLLYGGRENTSRVVLGAFAPHEEPCEDVFPISGITAKFPENAALSHRDFLGVLMALQITRESVGDILVSPGRCDFFVLEPVLYTILNELTKVGNTGVKTSIGVPGDFVVFERFESVRGTIGSARVDGLISMLVNISREKSARLIEQGHVERNFAPVENGAAAFAAGDTLSIRGCGRFIVDEIGAPTKKGRLPVICRKYV